MTSNVRANVGRFSATTVMLVLIVALVLIVLLVPQPPDESEGGMSSYSTGPGGAGIVYELAQRFGWHTERRITTLDSTRRAGDTRNTVQVVLAPDEDLGEHEIHALLENVRRGGGLIVSLSDDDVLRDSLGLGHGHRTTYLALQFDPTCAETLSRARALAMLPPESEAISWRNRALRHVDTLVTGEAAGTKLVAAVGLPFGKGRVAVIGGAGAFSNQAVSECRWGADLAAMKLIEYTRPPSSGGAAPVLVFDEFHHGFGQHGGSVSAAKTYLLRARSGRAIAQLLAAGLLLLFAVAPRPLVPRDDTRITRRSPLEHADALGRAYEDVHATRTATATLVGGLRRRMRGIIAVPASVGDGAFLEAVTRRIPSLGPTVAMVSRAQSAQLTNRDFAAVGEALAKIEAELLSTPSTRT